MEAMKATTLPYSKLRKADKDLIVTLLETSAMGPATTAQDVAHSYKIMTNAVISPGTIRKVLKDRNFSFRRTTKVAPDPSEARFEHVLRYWDIVSRIDPRNLFFFDEQPQGNKNKDVGKAWQRKGVPIQTSESSNYEVPCTLIAGVTLAGVEHGLPGVVCPRVMYGSVTYQEILDYFVRVVLPGIPPGGWIVVDNASPHVTGLAKLTVLAAKVQVGILFLPSKSPWWNPVELLFSWVKYRARRMKYDPDWCHLPLGARLLAATTKLENRFVVHFFRHCGYHLGDRFVAHPNRFSLNFDPSIDSSDSEQSSSEEDLDPVLDRVKSHATPSAS